VNYSSKKCSHSTECYVTLAELLVFTVCFTIVCIPDDMKVVICKDNTILVDRRPVCIQTSPTVDGWRCILKQQNTSYKFCYTFKFTSVVSGTVSCILTCKGSLSFFLHFPNVNVRIWGKWWPCIHFSPFLNI